MRQVEVTARARLHFGFLDLSGQGPRRFGGVGLAISEPVLHLRLQPAGTLIVEAPEEVRPRLEGIARRFCESVGLEARARVVADRVIPAHVGLGSGTQMALALGTGLARLHQLDLPAARIAALLGRTRRSGIGYHAFLHGGLLVDGGHAAEEPPATSVPPLLARHDMPEEWRLVLAIPAASGAVAGEVEEAAFRRLPPAPRESAIALARLVLMRLLPALVERDLPSFGEALAALQQTVGEAFAPVQGGPYHPAAAPLVRRLKDARACGVGQSSWGPTLYALAADAPEEARLVGLLRDADPRARVLAVRGWNRGASIAES
jgi:beta-ribofuranosylaminobenzene 5'-phosphate synthase